MALCGRREEGLKRRKQDLAQSAYSRPHRNGHTHPSSPYSGPSEWTLPISPSCPFLLTLLPATFPP